MMNFLASIISVILGLLVGVVEGFFLLIVLNGFTGSAGDYAVYTYIALAIIIALFAGIVAFFATSYFSKKSMNKALAVILSILISLVLCGVGDFVAILISAIVADTMWKK